jgi:hypothetical protein
MVVSPAPYLYCSFTGPRSLVLSIAFEARSATLDQQIMCHEHGQDSITRFAGPPYSFP